MERLFKCIKESIRKLAEAYDADKKQINDKIKIEIEYDGTDKKSNDQDPFDPYISDTIHVTYTDERDMELLERRRCEEEAEELKQKKLWYRFLRWMKGLNKSFIGETTGA